MASEPPEEVTIGDHKNPNWRVEPVDSWSGKLFFEHVETGKTYKTTESGELVEVDHE